MINTKSNKIKLTFSKNNHFSTLLFIIFFLIGFNIFSDYGVSYDEPDCRMTGLVNIKYILESIGAIIPEQLSNIPSLNSWINKDYGVGFELLTSSAELVLGLTDSKEIFEFRHLLNFILFFLAVIAIYFCIYLVTNKSKSTAIFGSLLIILSPRIFAESFYNCKDVVFLSTVAFYAFFQAKSVYNRSLFWSFSLSLAIALSINIRIMGVLFWFSAIFVEVGGLLFRFTTFRESWKNLCIVLLLTPVFFIIPFPYLWDSPFHKFIEVFTNMSHFRWTGKILFNGSQIWSTELPFYYIPTWILITTPVLYTVLFIIGLNFILIKNYICIKKKTLDASSMILLLYAILFFAPLVSVIIMKSVLYDGWRQLYFIYPFFVVIASFAFFMLASVKKIRIPLFLVCGLFFTHIIILMFRTHPNQNLYFNFLAGGNLKNRWEFDYWGLSNTYALKDILSDDGRSHITIASISSSVLDRACILLDPNDRARVKITSINEGPDYIFNNYRQLDHNSEKSIFSNGYKIFKRYQNSNEVFLSVYSKDQ